MTKRKSGDLFALFFAKKHKWCVSTGNRQEVGGSQVFLTPLISRPKPEKHRERAHSHPWRARTHTRNTTVTAVCFLPATPSSGCTHHNCQRITNTDSPFSTHSVWSCTGAPSATNGLYELLIAGRVSGGWRSSARFLISSLKSHSEKTGSWRLSFFPPHHRHHHKEKKKQLKVTSSFHFLMFIWPPGLHWSSLT